MSDAPATVVHVAARFAVGVAGFCLLSSIAIYLSEMTVMSFDKSITIAWPLLPPRRAADE
jgi:hypothetical protein